MEPLTAGISAVLVGIGGGIIISPHTSADLWLWLVCGGLVVSGSVAIAACTALLISYRRGKGLKAEAKDLNTEAVVATQETAETNPPAVGD